MTLIAQVSDIHAEEGAPSVDALRRAIAHIEPLMPDALIVSGDVSEGARAEGYRIAAEALDGFTSGPVLMVPGNVDRREAMRAGFPGAGYWTDEIRLHFCERVGGLTVIGLDVTVPGESAGEATPEVAAWLGERLAAAETPVLIMQHQHPYRTELPRIDRNMCRHGERIADAIAKAGNVVGIVCGHGHRAVRTTFAGVPAMMCPSMVSANPLPFAGRAMIGGTDAPAFMLHELTGTGLVSHVVTLPRS